jgi:hypothetical protein
LVSPADAKWQSIIAAYGSMWWVQNARNVRVKKIPAGSRPGDRAAWMGLGIARENWAWQVRGAWHWFPFLISPALCCFPTCNKSLQSLHVKMMAVIQGSTFWIPPSFHSWNNFPSAYHVFPCIWSIL